MRRGRALGLRLLALALFAIGLGCAASVSLVARVEGPTGEFRLEVRVEEALTEEERVLGLSEHESLAPGTGLLLRFPVEDELCIQNADVRFPIDAVFIDAGGVVRAIELHIAAGDASLRCHPETRDILEVGAGVASEVEVGDALFVDRG